MSETALLYYADSVTLTFIDKTLKLSTHSFTSNVVTVSLLCMGLKFLLTVNVTRHS